MIALDILIAVIAIPAIVGAVAVVRRDGYRRVPTLADQPRPDAVLAGRGRAR